MMGLRLVLFFSLTAALYAGEKGERLVESILPSLAYGRACWSSIDLQNLGDRPVTLQVESHRASGALAPLVGHPQVTVTLAPGETASYRLEVEEETGSAWVKIREKVPDPRLAPVVAISGHTECVADNQLRTTNREVAFPLRNPSYSTESGIMIGNLISLVNTSERPVRAWLCYSAGNLYSVPRQSGGAPDLKPICSLAFEDQIPPFGARQYPVEREGSSYFSIRTQGEAIVLQMLRPLDSNVRIYSVDSTVTFGGEAAPVK